MPGIFWIVPVAGVFTVIFAILLARNVLKRPTGHAQDERDRRYDFPGCLGIPEAPVHHHRHVFGGHRHYYRCAGRRAGAHGIGERRYSGLAIGWRTAVAFLVGAFCSGLAGFIGMYIAVKSNVRCAAAAQKSLTEAVTVALRGGAVSGFLITALSLIGVTVIFFAYGGDSNPEIAPHLIVGFGFGASFVALFAQLGGGIYTKAADVGADLVGKVESGIPEDDPRNPAVIADLVGDNVGDCAGRGADLFESTAAENIGAMILGICRLSGYRRISPGYSSRWCPRLRHDASMIGLLSVRAKESENAMNALNRGYYVAIGLSIVGLAITVHFMLDNWWLFGAGVVGIIASIVIVFVTQYYTEWRYRPVREMPRPPRPARPPTSSWACRSAFRRLLPPRLIIGIALLLSYWLGSRAASTAPGLSAPPWPPWAC